MNEFEYCHQLTLKLLATSNCFIGSDARKNIELYPWKVKNIDIVLFVNI